MSNEIENYNVPLLLKLSLHLDFSCTVLYTPLVPELSFCEPLNTMEEFTQPVSTNYHDKVLMSGYNWMFGHTSNTCESKVCFHALMA